MRLHPLLVCTTLVSLALPVASQGGDGPGRCKKDGGEIEVSGITDPFLLRDFAERCVRLNHVQVLGTHNSYHIEPAESLDLLLQISDPLVPGCGGPGDPCPSELSVVWDYTHIPLDEQFSSQGVRQIELDVFLDPEVPTLFANPLGDFLVAFFGLPPDPPHDPDGLLLDPGFKVLHVQDLDFRSRCLTLEGCLQTIQQWSAAHPGHLPLTVLVELKEEVLPDLGPPIPPFVTPIPFEAEDLDDLDSLIRSVFPPGQLITPDDVRRRRPTLEKAVLKDGWPTLGEAAGRVLFALDNGGAIRDLYVEGHPSLRGRVLFTDSPPGVAGGGLHEAQRSHRLPGRDQGSRLAWLHRPHPERRRHRGGALRPDHSPRRRARERRPVREQRLPGARPRLRNRILRRDPGWRTGAMQPAERPPRLPGRRARRSALAGVSRRTAEAVRCRSAP